MQFEGQACPFQSPANHEDISCPVAYGFAAGATVTHTIGFTPTALGPFTVGAACKQGAAPGVWTDPNAADNIASLSGEYTGPENEPPIAACDSYFVVRSGDLRVKAKGILANDFDREGGPLTARIVSTSFPGSRLTLNATTGAFRFRPGSRKAMATMVYRAVDGRGGESADTTVYIGVGQKVTTQCSPLKLDTPMDGPSTGEFYAWGDDDKIWQDGKWSTASWIFLPREAGQRKRIAVSRGRYADELEVGPGTLRVGVTTEAWSGVAVDAEVAAAAVSAGRRLEDLGHVVADASPAVDWEAVMQSSAGEMVAIAAPFLTAPRPPAPDRLEAVSRTVLEEAQELSALDLVAVFDAQNRVSRSVGAFFTEYDLLVTPTMGRLPAPHGTLDQDDPGHTTRSWLEALFAYGPFTVVFNISGSRRSACRRRGARADCRSASSSWPPRPRGPALLRRRLTAVRRGPRGRPRRRPCPRAAPGSAGGAGGRRGSTR